MIRFVWMRYSGMLLFTMLSATGFSQSKDSFVPCQEMPDIMQKYNADFRAVSRFYTPARATIPGNGFGVASAETSAGSPEKRARLQKLYNDYLKKVERISFKNLS